MNGIFRALITQSKFNPSETILHLFFDWAYNILMVSINIDDFAILSPILKFQLDWKSGKSHIAR